MAQERELHNHMAQLQKAGGEFWATIDLVSRNTHKDNASFEDIRANLSDAQFSFKIRYSDIAALAKMAACSEDETAKGSFLEYAICAALLVFRRAFVAH